MTGTDVRHRSTHRTVSTSRWSGGYRDYDLVKEFVIALVVVTLLTVGLAAIFSSPDEKQVDISTWSRSAPTDFVATAATELDGTSGTATYGAPYTHDASPARKIGARTPQNWFGATHPIDTAPAFVVRPRSGVPGDAALTAALAQWRS